MKFCKVLGIVLLILIILSLPNILLLLYGLSTLCNSGYPIPNDGVWYCEELQAQFKLGQGDSFTSSNDEYVVDASEDYVVINGDRIATAIDSDRGAKYVLIMLCSAWTNLTPLTARLLKLFAVLLRLIVWNFWRKQAAIFTVK